ncbi:MAG: hypothetical protein EBU90_26425, partial [Proteobacteria bacterium]|nr:hypothetical protein [Pseudomonadota bacterium]
MSSVKISQLSAISQLNSNTSNTLFVGVDIPSGVTGKFTAHTIAQGLFSNEVLNVGGNPVQYQNVVGQFSGNSVTYLQINNQNFDANGSADYVASTSDSNNANSFIDMGINGRLFSDPEYSSMKPYDGYLFSYGQSNVSYTGNLIVGTASANANVVIIAGGTLSGNVVGRISPSVFDFLKNLRVTGTIAPSQGIIYADGTTQNTSPLASGTYANSAFVAANSAGSYANSAFIKANSAFALTNTAVQNTSVININSLTLTGNLIANGLNQSASIDNITSNNVIFNRDITVSGTVYANDFIYTTKSYSGNQTALTLNFNNDNWSRANIAANFAATLANFVPGSEIILFITNVSTGPGSTHTITHGCSAINSSVGSTTFSLGGGTT